MLFMSELAERSGECGDEQHHLREGVLGQEDGEVAPAGSRDVRPAAERPRPPEEVDRDDCSDAPAVTSSVGTSFVANWGLLRPPAWRRIA
jgi:hypothetical protein